jgi:NTP-dependent ternary system trypsin peptidase co-occuring protein
VKVTGEGVPVESLVAVVKDAVRRGGVSSRAGDGGLRVSSVQLTLRVVAASGTGGGLSFRVPFTGMTLAFGAKVTSQDTHTIDLTLVPPDDPGRVVRGADVADALVNAIATIRGITAAAAGGDDPWVLANGTVEISFAVTAAGAISLGVEGELSREITHTLRLGLAPR